MKGYIYCYTFENGKTYIGQTIQLQQRKINHLYNARKGCQEYFYRALRKYNYKYKFDILKIISDNDKKSLINKLNKYEIYFIKTLKSLYNENGYNIQIGGDNHTSEISARKVSTTKKNNKKYKIIAQKAGMENAKIVVALDKYGNIIREFDCIKNAERFYNLKNGTISKHIHSLYSWSNQANCYFRFKDKDYDKRKKAFIGKYDDNNNLVEVYIKFDDIEYNSYYICKYINKNIKYQGFYWKYLGGDANVRKK